MASAVADPDPVLFYEHIALYRDPRIKQVLAAAAPPVPIGTAALRRAGGDLAIISYGAYVHVAMRVAARLAADGIDAAVLDLRTLAPLDRGAILAVARHCHRVLIVHEDSRTGGIGESVAALIQEEAFEWLDAPVRIVARARHAGAVLAAARSGVPARRGRHRARRPPAGALLTPPGDALPGRRTDRGVVCHERCNKVSFLTHDPEAATMPALPQCCSVA